ncbi:MAG: HAMP domain-containing sensor histidine kinase [Pleurocapsa sp. MO_226.B13]|nr:HAMP domain-containing sensor histidine kinase [Pleurocapsa sp. MO_226.B13]
MKSQSADSKSTKLAVSHGIFGEARTRIFAWYIFLMAVLVGLSIPIFTRIIFVQVDLRVEEDLQEEFESFQESLAKTDLTTDDSPQEKAAQVFDDFLLYKIPADKTFLIATIDGEFYRASPAGLPKVINRNSQLLARLARTNEPIKKQQAIEDPQFGKMVYETELLVIDDKPVGVLIVALIVDGEKEEALEAVVIVIQVLIVAFVIGLILAWIAAGKVLQPISSLIQTASSIDDSDLSRRIPVNSSGEMGKLATTFNRMMDRLEASFITQREFINDAGHELRTPITIIRGHLELLDDDPQERKETIALVLDELDRMTRFVEDLILLAKTERREFLELDTIDLTQFTEELYSKAQAIASRNWQLDHKASGNTIGDHQRITQAMMNLIINAVQHTNETDTIALGSAIEDGYVRFWVRDMGLGIAPEDRHRIFQRFARAAKSRRRSDGAGLGLSIVQAIAQAHGGKVELYSKLGIGSTFTLTLPIEATIEKKYN